MTLQEPVSAGRRLYTAIVIGLLGGAWTTVFERAKPTHFPSDYEQVWYAARMVLAGQDPYQLIGPGRWLNYGWAFRYPLPAALVAIPTAPFSVDVAAGIFMGIGLGCLAWALMRYGHAPLIGLLSASTIAVTTSVQWSPLLAAATVIAPLGFVLVAKPTIGLAMFAVRPSRWAVLGGLALSAVAFLLNPLWLAEWREALTDRSILTAIALHPGGLTALLCLCRWRRPEARMLAVLACVPMTPNLYETVPLLLIPRRWWEAALLVAASYVVFWQTLRVPWLDPSYYPTNMTNSANAIALVLYPLATVLVVRRPNEGAVPAWLERSVTRCPAWMRGVPA